MNYGGEKLEVDTSRLSNCLKWGAPVARSIEPQKKLMTEVSGSVLAEYQ